MEYSNYNITIVLYICCIYTYTRMDVPTVTTTSAHRPSPSPDEMKTIMIKKTYKDYNMFTLCIVPLLYQFFLFISFFLYRHTSGHVTQLDM